MGWSSALVLSTSSLPPLFMRYSFEVMHLYQPAKLAALSIGWNFVTAMDSLPHKAIAIKELALNRDRNSMVWCLYSSIETEKQLRWADTIAQFAERFVWSCKWKTYFPWNAHSITGTTSTTNGWPQIDHRTRTTQRHHTKAIPSTNYVSVQPITHAFKDQRSHYSLLNKHTSVWVFSEHTGNDK